MQSWRYVRWSQSNAAQNSRLMLPGWRRRSSGSGSRLSLGGGGEVLTGSEDEAVPVLLQARFRGHARAQARQGGLRCGRTADHRFVGNGALQRYAREGGRRSGRKTRVERTQGSGVVVGGGRGDLWMEAEDWLNFTVNCAGSHWFRSMTSYMGSTFSTCRWFSGTLEFWVAL